MAIAAATAPTPSSPRLHIINVMLLMLPIMNTVSTWFTTSNPVTMPVPNYVLMNGSVTEDRFFYVSEPRLYDDLNRFNSYSPLVLVRDISCSLAGVETQYTSNLGNFHGSVLAIGGGRGFGPYMSDQLAQIGSTDQTFLLQPGFGHIDHFMTARHREFVEEPIFRWVTRVFGGR